MGNILGMLMINCKKYSLYLTLCFHTLSNVQNNLQHVYIITSFDASFIMLIVVIYDSVLV